jgi:hypothetical protein
LRFCLALILSLFACSVHAQSAYDTIKNRLEGALGLSLSHLQQITLAKDLARSAYLAKNPALLPARATPLFCVGIAQVKPPTALCSDLNGALYSARGLNLGSAAAVHARTGYLLLVGEGEPSGKYLGGQSGFSAKWLGGNAATYPRLASAAASGGFVLRARYNPGNADRLETLIIEPYL